MRFLIADGSQVVRSALRLLLEHHMTGAEVLEATNLADIVRVLAEQEIDTTFIDWYLRPEGGEAALNHVRKHQPHSSVIILSGSPEIEKDALEAGADAFVSKGDPPDQLLAVLRHLVTCRAAAPGTLDDAPQHTQHNACTATDSPGRALSVRHLASLAA